MPQTGNSEKEIIEFLPDINTEDERYKAFVDILFGADKRHLDKLIEARSQKEAVLNSQIEECDRKIVQRKIARSNKDYNLTQAAHLLKVHRQTIYYWMKKNWVKPKRDYRNYPVFTVLDIENIIKWRNSLKQERFFRL